MTLGGITVGGAALGSASAGAVTEVQLPGRTLQLVRPPNETEPVGAGGYGGAALGGAAVGSAATKQRHLPTITATGAGTATANAPGRTLDLSRTTPTVAQLARMPSRTLDLSRQVPTATGAGTASAQVPGRTVQLSRIVPAAGFINWVLDGQELPGDRDESATFDSLSLSFRVQTSTLTDVLRPLKTNEGQVDVLTTDDGGFVAIDRADGGNTYTLIPPVGRDPLRRAGDYLVSGYEEDLVSQAVDEWDVSLDLTPDANRDDAPSINETPTGDDWGITTRYGTIATDRVDADFLGTGADGVERFEVVMRLTKEQAHVFEAALNRLHGVRVRSVPDATNRAVDDTAGDDMTLTVDSPTEDVVADGEYVVLGWSSERINDAWNRVSMEIAAEG